MRKPFNGSYRLTQKWGENPDTYARFGLKGHNGLDYATPTGTEIVAPHDGTIKESAHDPEGYGDYLKVESDKEGSVLSHLKEFKVKVGDVVSEGQVIALSDNTGFSTGPHLHWGYYKIPRDRQDGYLGYINQLPLLDEKDGDYYLGIDLNNKESIKICVETWKNVTDGKYKTEGEYGELNGRLKEAYSTIESLKDQLAQSNTSLHTTEESLRQVQESFEKFMAQENSFADKADDLERQFKEFKESTRNFYALLERELKLSTSSDADLVRQETIVNTLVTALKNASHEDCDETIRTLENRLEDAGITITKLLKKKEKTMESKRFALNKEDLLRWGKNILIFAGPALLVLLASFRDLIPSDAIWGALALYTLNIVTDLLRKFVANNQR